MIQAPLLRSEEAGREAFADAYRKHFHSTMRFLISRGVCVDLAEEFAQAAWAKGWELLPQLRDPSMTLAWVNSIAGDLHRQSLREAPLTEELNIDSAALPCVDISAILVRHPLRQRPSSDRALWQAYRLGGVGFKQLPGSGNVTKPAFA
jgi:DNA-directed RNA polymerase specialized sigma24 family protein